MNNRTDKQYYINAARNAQPNSLRLYINRKLLEWRTYFQKHRKAIKWTVIILVIIAVANAIDESKKRDYWEAHKNDMHYSGVFDAPDPNPYPDKGFH